MRKNEKFSYDVANENWISITYVLHLYFFLPSLFLYLNILYIHYIQVLIIMFHNTV